MKQPKKAYYYRKAYRSGYSRVRRFETHYVIDGNTFVVGTLVPGIGEVNLRSLRAYFGPLEVVK